MSTPTGITNDGAFAELLETARAAPEYNQWVAEQFLPFIGNRVVEVGCGIGNLSEFWADRQIFVGVDTEPGCVAKSTERFRDRPNVKIVHDAVGAPDWVQRWSGHRFDTVIAINVLEHIRDDLGALEGWRQIVESGGGGHICIFVPAFEFAFSPFDRRYGHFRRYSKEVLRDKLLAAGLDIEELRYFNMPGLIAWWTMFVMMKRDRDAGDVVPAFSRYIVPMVRRLEARISPPFGNSIVAVCKVRPKAE
ncbi:MAG: hypothetical protein QOI66_3906 [Myxococcales bacterium]|jgi:SAM-dependent methyltransferase|nr:hypothetical protein [Myxococcales bacterium]